MWVLRKNALGVNQNNAEIPISKIQTEESIEQITWYFQQHKKYNNNSVNNINIKKEDEGVTASRVIKNN